MKASDVLHGTTWGRPFVLVAMGYEDKRTRRKLRPKVFALIKKVAETEFNLACIRADQVQKPGTDLREKLHELINRASIVVAEISEMRPNVFYEFGYAAARDKVPVPIIEKGCRAPYNIRGLETIEYDNTPTGLKQLRKDLVPIFRARLTKGPPLLRDMLMPSVAHQSYVVLNPKFPKPENPIQGQAPDRRTFGDYLGVLGVVSAFGSFYGDIKGVELVSAQHTDPKLLDRNANLYLIGSEKVNRFSPRMLRLLCRAPGPQWTFGPKSGWSKGKKGDWPVGLFRNGKEEEGKLGRRKGSTKKIWLSDYGLIVRGPHPKHRDRLVMIMAGPHTLGSAAACLAATRPALIERIKAKLPAGVVEDKSSAFWVFVRGAASAKDYLLDEKGVEILEAGVYPRS